MDFAQLHSFAGRWVALTSNGQVAGSGATGPEARAAGEAADAGAPLTVRYVPDLSGKPLTLSPLLGSLEPILATIERPVFLVGGAVRDAVLEHASHDLDFAVPEKGIKTAFKVGDALGKPAYPLDKTRDTGRVMVAEHKTYLDFVAFRGPDLEADLRDRDVTINAMALPALARTTAELIDPFGGRDDLANRLIRQVHPESITNDPIRGLRVVRLAAQHGFEIEPETRAAARRALQHLDRPSVERVRDELVNLLRHKPAVGLPLLHELGGLADVLPEVARLEGIEQPPPHRYPVLKHTFATVAALPEAINYLTETNKSWAVVLESHVMRTVTGGLSGRDLLVLSALLHDVGKADTHTIDADGRIRFFGHDQVGAKLAAERLTALRFSREVVRHVEETVRGHMRPLLLANERSLTSTAVHRLLKQTAKAGLDVAVVALADHIGTYGAGEALGSPEWNRLVEVVHRICLHYFDHFARRETEPLINGSMIMTELGLEPGPWIGRLLEQIEEAQVEGKIKTPAEALAFAKEKINK